MNTANSKWINRTNKLSAGFVLCAMGLYAQPYAYVAASEGWTISVVNTATYAVVGQISITAPGGLAVTPDGAYVYVASTTAATVSVISTASNSVAATIYVGTPQIALSISPNGSLVYTVDQNANQVSVISTASKLLVANIPVGSHPSGVAFSPDGTRAFVTNTWSNSVSVIDTASSAVINTFATGLGSSGVVVSPNGSVVYVANAYSNTVTAHNTASGATVATIAGMNYPSGLAVTPNGSRVYVANTNGGTIGVIDTNSNTLSSTVGVGNSPMSVAISSDGARAYVVDNYDWALAVMDVNSNAVLTNIRGVGIYPSAVAMIPAAPQAQACSYSISPGSASYGSGGGNGSVTVTVAAGCPWSASSNSSWLTVTGGASGNGSGTVFFSAAANSSTGAISGSLNIAGRIFSVSEAGISCSYSLSAYAAVMTAAGGAGSVVASTAPGCPWTVTSDSSWLTVTSASSGSGSGLMLFQTAANTGPARTGNLNIAGQTFQVSQAGGSTGGGGGGSNIALGKPASQSSTYPLSTAGPAGAVDGNTDGNWWNGSVTTTDLNTNAWWQVDLGAPATVNSIVIWNRTDCCSSRLSDYWVFVSNTPFAAWDTPGTLQYRAGTWATHQTTMPYPSSTIAVGAQGQYVRVQLTGTDYLSLAEVQVAGTLGSGGSNLAQGKPASQSSTYPLATAGAAGAVDGNTDGSFWDGSVTATNGDTNAWWEVDLGASATVNSIVIWNRTDCCSSRLTDYWVFVSNTPFAAWDTPATLQYRAGTWGSHQTTMPSPATNIAVGGAQGRYVRVQLTGTDYLSLAEVQVY